MPRFSGTPVEDDQQRKPRFGGTPVPEGGPTQENADIVAAGPTKENAEVSTHNKQYLRDQYNQMPWYGKAGQALDDTLRYGGDTLSFGGLDKAASMLSGTPIDEERQKTADARKRSTGADIGLDAAMFMRAPQLVSRYAPGILGMAADAGLYSGAQSAGHGNDLRQVEKDTAIGAGGGLAAGAVLPLARVGTKLLEKSSPLFNPGASAAYAAYGVHDPINSALAAGAHAGVGMAARGVRSAMDSPLGAALQRRLLDVGRMTPGMQDYYKGY